MFLDCEQLKQKTGGEIDWLKFRFNLNLSPLYSSGFSLRIMTPTIGLGPTFMLGPPVFYLISAKKKKKWNFFIHISSVQKPFSWLKCISQIKRFTAAAPLWTPWMHKVNLRPLPNVPHQQQSIASPPNAEHQARGCTLSLRQKISFSLNT